MDREEYKPIEGDIANVLLRNMMRFNRGLHLLMGVALVVTAVMALGLFLYDVYSAFTTRSMISGMVHALGSLLILWTLSELLDAEIHYLRDGMFKVAIFIEVSIAAIIRKILILSAEGLNNLTEEALYLTALLVLGVVYWLLSRSNR